MSLRFSMSRTRIGAETCDNGSAPGGAINTLRGLTRSSDFTREGLAMQATRKDDALATLASFTYTQTVAGCWEWNGYCDPNGYARIYDREAKRIEWAHRWSHRHFTGPIPERHDIDHTCENTRCVNPEHLEAVTRAEHIRRTMQRLGKDDLHSAAAKLRILGLTYSEIAAALNYSGREGAAAAVNAAISKGLVDAGEIPRVVRLTDDERNDIGALVSMGVPQAVVGEVYGLHPSHVSRVSRGVTSRSTQRESA